MRKSRRQAVSGSEQLTSTAPRALTRRLTFRCRQRSRSLRKRQQKKGRRSRGRHLLVLHRQVMARRFLGRKSSGTMVLQQP